MLSPPSGTSALAPVFAAGEFTPAERDLLERAYRLAADAHAGQFRASGDPYITHPLAVAVLTAEWGLDAAAVAAALCHDVVEDTPATLADVRAACGPEVETLVAGLTKLDGLRFAHHSQDAAAEWRRMIVALAADLRVLVVKLADRVHNLRTLAALAPERRRRIAAETLAIFAPLAARLTMHEVKRELEDRAFAELEPDAYAEIDRLIAARRHALDAMIARTSADLTAAMAAAGLVAEISGRVKHVYSMYAKMVRSGRPLDQIWDLAGLRVVVGTDADCYAALGIVHASFPPMPGRFKDYIARPKWGVYQSLHVTVLVDGHPLEVQIRTRAMHLRAERGVAAHWRYKEGGMHPPAWVDRLREAVDDAGPDVVDELVADLARAEIHCFTPAGDVVVLPQGATPVDFAYRVHTEIGHRCVGARVDGRLVPLAAPLPDGAQVTILTRPDGRPRRDWLDHVVTSRARAKIRAELRRLEPVVGPTGRELLLAALRDAGLGGADPGDDRVRAAARRLGFADVAALVAALDASRLPRSRLAAALRTAAPRPRRPARRRDAPDVPTVEVDGVTGLPVRLAACCRPAPPATIVAFVGRSGTSVHRSDCRQLPALRQRVQAGTGQLLAARFGDGTGTVVGVEVAAFDRPRLLADVAHLLAEHGLDVLNARAHTPAPMHAELAFTARTLDPDRIDDLLVALRAVDGVFSAHLVAPEV